MIRLFFLVFLALGRAQAGDISVSLKIQDQGIYQLEGRFVTSAPKEKAWEVLSDYEHLAVFVSSMRSSAVKERRGDVILLEQESIARAFFFRKTIHVLLEVREEPMGRIVFQDVSRRSFERYSGSWELAEAPGGVLVTYRLEAKGGFVAPQFVAKGASRRMIQKLLDEVRTEMERRSPL